jgi:PAS domain S-box-containing protein
MTNGLETQPSPEQAQRPDAGSGLLRQFPRLPGTALPRSAGLLLVVGTILVFEIVQAVGIRIPVPAALLLLAVAYATYLDGVRVGVMAGAVAVVYEFYDYLWRGAALTDASSPLLRAAGLAAITVLVIVLIAAFRRRLDAVLLNERRLLEVAEARRSELAAALSNVERAQEAIRFQARLLDAVGQAVIATDGWGRIVYWNGPASRLFGISTADATQRLITDAMPDPPGSISTLDRLRRGSGGSGEVEVKRPDDTRVTVLFHDAPIRDNDEERSVGLVRIATDVTKRKHVERAQRLLAEAGSALAASMDYQSTIRSVARLCVPAFADCCLIDVVEEDGTARRLEAAHIDETREADVRADGEPYEVGPQSLNPIAEVIATGMPRFYPHITEASLRESRDAAHADWLRRQGFRSAIIAPLRAGGRTLGAVSFYRQVTDAAYEEPDLLLAEELANRAATAIQQARLFESAMIANRAKSDFLAVMSHELRTPLTTITGYTDLMLAHVPQALPAKHRAYVERIRLAAAHLLSLIEQILVFARLEARREQMQPERVAVADVLRDAAALIEPVARERGIDFSVEATCADTFIESDKTKLRQILLNLLANAVKFTDDGEVLLSAAAANGSVIFTVRDTGIGIDSQHLGSIFNPFWQVDQSSTRRAGGAGLGLSVTRKLARMLGGEVSVDSSPGGGTTFTVRLPLVWSPEENEAHRPNGSGRVEVDPSTGRG